MFKLVADLLSPVLNAPYVLRVRRNHGLEHGTVHMLNRQKYILSGISSLTGFVLIGDVPTEKVQKAADEALRRFRKGERALAIHPNCGTNLVTSVLLTTFIGAAGFAGTTRRQAWERFGMVALLMMGAALYSLPLGLKLQEHFTTSGDMGDLEVVRVTRSEVPLPGGRRLVLHNVITH
jgi:hypothetical protein